MLWTIFAILLIAWIVLMALKITLGGLVYILLAAAVIVLIYRLATGRRVV
jgi:hypothetical protein